MFKLLEKNKELTFGAIAFLILIALGLTVYVTLNNLLKIVDQALETNIRSGQTVEHFNLQGAKSLNLK